MQLRNKVAIVTGAGAGFGEAIARLYAAEGAKVAIADLRGEAAQRVAGEIGGNAIAVSCDVSRKADVQALVAATVEAFGGLDIMVNNAGIVHRSQSLVELDEATFDRLFAVNVKSIYLTTQAVLPALRKRGGGVILNIGSTGGIRPRPGLTWYNATKGAVNLLSKSMAVELAPEKIRVNAICPVIAATGMLDTIVGGPATPEAHDRFLATIPLGRMTTPLDVARACLWLASDAADFITGVAFPVDGGRTI